LGKPKHSWKTPRKFGKTYANRKNPSKYRETQENINHTWKNPSTLGKPSAKEVKNLVTTVFVNTDFGRIQLQQAHQTAATTNILRSIYKKPKYINKLLELATAKSSLQKYSSIIVHTVSQT